MWHKLSNPKTSGSSSFIDCSLKRFLKSVTRVIFQYNKKFFTQIDGVSMGNPLAHTIANYFMGTLEKSLLNTEDENNPVPYLRYVDDIFCNFRKQFYFKTSTKN